jgi:Sugar (pentulose and hexulose) kinases
MKKPGLAIVDMGASGGRITVASKEDDARMSFTTVHEFNHPVHVFSQGQGGGALVRRYWNPGVIYENIVTGLLAVPKDVELQAVGIDGWGSDGAWLDKDGDILGLPSQGRDRRWNEANAEIEEILPDRRRFQLTGVRNESFCLINLLYWYAKHNPARVDLAKVFLPMPALFTYWLCGEQIVERTWIGANQLLGTDDQYSGEIFTKLGLPLDKMPAIVTSGTVLGKLHRPLAELTGHHNCRVVVPAHHDTACAFAAAKTINAGPNTLVISAGTWWLSGVMVDEAVVSDAAYDAVLTNVPGHTGWLLHYIGFGSWPAQELRRQWSIEDGKQMNWDEFNILAESDRDLPVAFNLNDPRLLSPESMAAALCDCAGLESASRGRLARLVYDALCESIVILMANLSKITKRTFDDILIIGGGAKNDCLNQRLANATGVPVRCRLPNATTLGNAFIQAHALGWYSSLDEASNTVDLGEEKVFSPE